MIYIVVFDSNGKIVGRIGTVDRGNLSHYELAVEIDSKTFDSAPEMWAEVNVSTGTLRPQFGKVDPR